MVCEHAGLAWKRNDLESNIYTSIRAGKAGAGAGGVDAHQRSRPPLLPLEASG
jgi:hypothetical protein